MSGYKRTIQEYKPAGFWSFDGEPFDPTTRLYDHSPLVVFDESSTGNDGLLLVGSDEPQFAYRAGMASLVSLEPAQQHAMSFGHYGVVRGLYPKAIVQIPHAPAYDTSPAFGSFCWQFLFNKKSDEVEIRKQTPHMYINHPRTLLHKPGQLTFTINDRWSSEDQLEVAFPAEIVATIPISRFPRFYDQTHHVVCNWEVRRMQEQSYGGTATIYIDGVEVFRESKAFADAAPDTSPNLPAEIGGRSSGPYPHDRATSSTIIDAVAYWPRHLKKIEIFRLFKKIWSYLDMIKLKSPVLLLTFQDEPNANSSRVEVEKGPGGLYVNQTGAVTRYRPGPPNIPGSRSFLFNNAMVMVRRDDAYYSQNPVTVDRENYAIEFWFSASSSERAVLFSMQGKERPYTGPLVELNVGASGAWANGQIAFTEADGVTVASPPGNFYNNGMWHHGIIQRRAGEFMELFLDGQLVVSERKVLQPNLTAWPSDINLMGTSPGRLSCAGHMAFFALYTGKTFTDFEASSRFDYATIYRVRGNTTLRGIPYRARVRLYDYITGELMEEMESATADGLFSFYLKDNSLVNAFVAAMNDQNVRVRAFGPLVPAEIPDPPVG